MKNRRAFLTLILAGALASAFFCGRARAAGEDKAARLATLQQYMETELATFEAGFKKEKPETVTRDISAAALASVMLSQDAARAEALLRRIFQAQNMQVGSPDYGDVPWQLNHPEVKDPNAIQFTTLSLAPLFIKYGDLFPKEFVEEARPHLQAALSALKQKKVAVSYTNIFLMKFANEIMLGKYLGDEASVAEGLAAFKDWLRFTRENGITEYNSAVYSGVQLVVLHTLYSMVPDPEVRKLTTTALDYLWTDAAANYFAPAEALSGSTSRTYSFLFYDLNLNLFYYLFAIQPNPPGRVGELSAEVLTWANGVWGGYAPSEELTELALQANKEIRQKTGPGAGQDRSNFITPSFALGSSSFFYEHQDRQISLLLNSPKKLPALSVVLDPFSAPYGKIRVLETHGGHFKITHLRNSIASVQDGGAVLALLDLAAEAGRKMGASVATNIVFPLGTDGLYLNGQPFTWTKEATKVPPGSTVVLREGKSAVAFRIFQADGAMDGYPLFFLRNDGKPYKAARLVAYHFRGDEGIKPVKELRSGVLILAAECGTDEAFAKFLADAQAWKVTDQEEKGIWSASAAGPSLTQPGETKTLAAALDIAGRAPASRSIDSVPYQTTVFSVNGSDFAAPIWKQVGDELQVPPAATEKAVTAQ